ncbi:unnamed protein product, partial [Iphiclides podalirius]
MPTVAAAAAAEWRRAAAGAASLPGLIRASHATRSIASLPPSIIQRAMPSPPPPRTKGGRAHRSDTYQPSGQTLSVPALVGHELARLARYVKGASLRVFARWARSRRALVAGSRAECRHQVMQRAATVARTGKSNLGGETLRAHPRRYPPPRELRIIGRAKGSRPRGPRFCE